MINEKNDRIKDFKLLAIRPLKGCAKKYRKVLKAGEIYKFHNDYHYYDLENIELLPNSISIEDKDVSYIKHIPTSSGSLYDVKDLNINISAIVGKNGSGKSTLIDLLFAFSYSISIKNGVLKQKKYLEDEIKKGNQIQLNKKRKSDIENTINQIHVEIFYTKNDKFFKLVNNTDDTFTQYVYNEGWTTTEFDFNNYFYTLAINYSLYGLNEKENNYLYSLFHKNDGYQTPIVINPYRKDGNIDVNSEFHLAQSRVLANLSEESLPNPVLLEDKVLEKIKFEIYFDDLESINAISYKQVYQKFNDIHNKTVITFLNDISKELIGYNIDDEKVQIFNDFLKEDLDIENEEPKHVMHESIGETIEYEDSILYLFVRYAINKVFKICSRYDNYRELFYDSSIKDRQFHVPNLKDLSGLINQLKKDNSHITLKLKQCLYTIKEEYFNQDWNVTLIEDDPRSLKFDILMGMSQLKEKILKAKEKNKINEIIELIPVAFVKPSLFIKEDIDESKSTFKQLSSGELQLIHSLHNIYYHLNNINSVFNSNKDNINYSSVNIVFDEVELYFHPDFQRKLIFELIKGLEKLNINNISCLNILFSTHSPFILSDIPSSNILSLEKGEIKNNTQQTFGANIHDLLADSFFLEGGFMGEFAEKQIQTIIIDLNNKKNNKRKSKIIEKIQLIGEPFLKEKLMEMYYQKYDKQKKIKDLETQLAKLKLEND